MGDTERELAGVAGQTESLSQVPAHEATNFFSLSRAVLVWWKTLTIMLGCRLRCEFFISAKEYRCQCLKVSPLTVFLILLV